MKGSETPKMTYRTRHPAPPAAILIRIRHAARGPWHPVPLLATVPGWVQVDDDGPLWVQWEAVFPGDWEALATFERLKLEVN